MPKKAFAASTKAALTTARTSKTKPTKDAASVVPPVQQSTSSVKSDAASSPMGREREWTRDPDAAAAALKKQRDANEREIADKARVERQEAELQRKKNHEELSRLLEGAPRKERNANRDRGPSQDRGFGF